MKKILRDTCILASLMILAVFATSIIWSGVTDEIKLILQLFLLALMISVINNLVGWFYPSPFWMAFIYVGAVLVMAYFLDSFMIKKDIEYINNKINSRG